MCKTSVPSCWYTPFDCSTLDGPGQKTLPVPEPERQVDCAGFWRRPSQFRTDSAE